MQGWLNGIYRRTDVCCSCRWKSIENHLATDIVLHQSKLQSIEMTTHAVLVVHTLLWIGFKCCEQCPELCGPMGETCILSGLNDLSKENSYWISLVLNVQFNLSALEGSQT